MTTPAHCTCNRCCTCGATRGTDRWSEPCLDLRIPRMPTKKLVGMEAVERMIAIALVTERERIATALRTVADRFGGPVKAALEQVAREVGGT